ncbi:2-succinyl-5-enolpyruvyl-6-hydroxy-3-cyclohexene-1-carboxylate synthase [Pseudoclavibacter endophyticus]|uniref:2-succinyl-5-enolpyruvyl-6-hydroxy-3- cyclohexene-1-carboxylic-acid synthase n=1 Tax=Pseudoclavibacter endophyticus TaxID=1778590 RepID=UPI001668CF12|nr:2-succinyl-5-enolpyruvyl-6-hydroxy-3-cyclohexene-1-carboxylic-acid synthase [Pseudoclavibacter endophyticus]GGA69141.1 2-succinyl-5-enolpyruvyl-6-hydroxy-3-cyclohexene-1-carboxylate synthase [Pseudoclavibacter endophyticus]
MNDAGRVREFATTAQPPAATSPAEAPAEQTATSASASQSQSPGRSQPADERTAPSTAFAARLLGEAVRLGMRDLVLCPGSRSQALALVAAELEARGRLRLHVRHDERSAAFFALGLARETARGVAVVTTSGTAVANLHPAMLEAFHAGVPLVAITADRPPELVGVGANQATVQPGVFGPLVPFVDVPAPGGLDASDDDRRARELAVSITDTRGALHVNVAFRDPLSSALPDLDAVLGEAPPARRERATVRENERVRTIDPADGVPTLVVAGDLAGPDAERVAHEAGLPLVAEVSSGSRFGRNLVIAYRELLGHASPSPELRDLVGRVLVFGHPTLSREVPALVARDDVEAIVVGPTGGEPYGPPARVAERVDRIEIARNETPRSTDVRAHRGELVDPRAWLRAWVRASHELVAAASSDPPAPDLNAVVSSAHAERSRFARGELAVARQSVTRELLVDAVWRATWPHDRLVLGASRLVRVLDGRATGKPLRVHANRGLAGIDGTIATALGVAAASQSDFAPSAAGVTRVLLGDLAFLHDAGSLLAGQGGEPAPRMQIIVGNDGGGTIFDGLEVGNSAGRAALERVLYTPHAADLRAIATAYGWHHIRAATRAELEAALTSHEHERIVVEVPLPR